MPTPKLKGTAVQNTDVAAFIRKHGPASFSKPNGPDKTILYYPDTSPQEEGETPEFKDYAGTKTPGRKTTVIQSPRGSKVVTKTRTVNAGVPQQDASSSNLNEAAKEADIEKIDFEEEEKSDSDIEKSADREEADDEVEQVEPDSEEELEEKMDYNDMTKDQLYKLADEKDISGRSTMNKDQLIQAIKAEE